jgi:hypothetical protein
VFYGPVIFSYRPRSFFLNDYLGNTLDLKWNYFHLGNLIVQFKKLDIQLGKPVIFINDLIGRISHQSQHQATCQLTHTPPLCLSWNQKSTLNLTHTSLDLTKSQKNTN